MDSNSMKARNTHQTRHIQIRAWLLALAGTTILSASALAADNPAPEVPDQIKVKVGNVVYFHGFGEGVQIYTWNGKSWGTAVPEATLFDSDHKIVATHFAGPTWKSTTGSEVKGAVAAPPLPMKPDAIPWLLLSAVSTNGPGTFADTTFIQRVNTTGGKAPSTDGTATGQVARVPYTADYFFYRRQ